MKRTIKEVYDLIKEKRENAISEQVRLYKINALETDQKYVCGNKDAYNDVLSLIKSNHLLEEDKETQKKLKALEIIINKSVEMSLLKICEDVMAYNNEVKELYWLTREEFEIVKSIINPFDEGGIN